MEYIDLVITSKMIHIPIERKNIKKVRLRVYPNGDVRISAPYDVSYKWLKEYASGKKDWIKIKLDSFSSTTGIEAIIKINNGTTIKFLGSNYFAEIIKSEKRMIVLDENHLKILINNIENNYLVKRKLDEWLKYNLENKAAELLSKLYPIVKKYGMKEPIIKIRKMKTLWGSCSKEKNTITLNFYLYQAKPMYIEYVLLHELLHLIHRNHTKEYYSMLSLYMPDWKERKKHLDNEIVQDIL